MTHTTVLHPICDYVDGLAQDCRNSSDNALDLRIAIDIILETINMDYLPSPSHL